MWGFSMRFNDSSCRNVEVCWDFSFQVAQIWLLIRKSRFPFLICSAIVSSRHLITCTDSNVILYSRYYCETGWHKGTFFETWHFVSEKSFGEWKTFISRMFRMNRIWKMFCWKWLSSKRISWDFAHCLDLIFRNTITNIICKRGIHAIFCKHSLSNSAKWKIKPMSTIVSNYKRKLSNRTVMKTKEDHTKTSLEIKVKS